MIITEVKDRTPSLTDRLIEVWEDSVRATHLFLKNEEVENIKKYVPQAVEGVSHLIIAKNEEGPVAFMGVEEKRIEMLFVLSGQRGNGLGKSLIRYGIENFGADEVTVNEQNTSAVGFYEHMGFKTYKRSDTDEQGSPYPLLYMKL